MIALDSQLWEPSIIGTLGPPNLLFDLADSKPMYYRALPVHYADDNVQMSPTTEVRLARVVTDMDWLFRTITEGLGLGPAPSMVPMVAVVITSRSGEIIRCIGVSIDPREPRLGRLYGMWSSEDSPPITTPSMRRVLVDAWWRLFRALAKRGIVAILANSHRIFDEHREDILMHLGGFRLATDVCNERALSIVDSLETVAVWCAEVRRGEVTAFRTVGRWEQAKSDEADQYIVRVLMTEMRLFLEDSAEKERRSQGDSPMLAISPHEFLIRGTFGLSGSREWGCRTLAAEGTSHRRGLSEFGMPSGVSRYAAIAFLNWAEERFQHL